MLKIVLIRKQPIRWPRQHFWNTSVLYYVLGKLPTKEIIINFEVDTAIHYKLLANLQLTSCVTL